MTSGVTMPRQLIQMISAFPAPDHVVRGLAIIQGELETGLTESILLDLVGLEDRQSVDEEDVAHGWSWCSSALG